jgi:hypothetical protein
MREEYLRMKKRRRRLLQGGAHTAPRKLAHFVKVEIDMLNASILALERRYDFGAFEVGPSK